MKRYLIIILMLVSAEFYSQSITNELKNDAKFQIRDFNSVLLFDADKSANLKLKGNLTIANGKVEYNFPDSDGKKGQVIKTDGNGNLDWIETEQIETEHIYFIICTENSASTDETTIENSFAGEVRIVTGLGVRYIASNFTYCDGRTLLISEYPELYEVLGTIYGGDGEKTFKLPDFTDKIPVGI